MINFKLRRAFLPQLVRKGEESYRSSRKRYNLRSTPNNQRSSMKKIQDFIPAFKIIQLVLFFRKTFHENNMFIVCLIEKTWALQTV